MIQTFPVKADKSPACKAWQTYEGEVSTLMYGVSPPTGIYIIDSDSHKNPNVQKEIEQVLGCSISWEASLIQNTLNGGTHHAFIVPKDSVLINDSELFGVLGFDTRASGRGYIASGKGYSVNGAERVEELFDDIFLPELPLQAVEALSRKVKEPTEGGELMDMVNKAEILVTNPDGSPLTSKQIKATLSALPAEIGTDNESWTKVCAGMRRQGLAMGMTCNERSNKMYKLFNAWSKSRFDGNDTEWRDCEAKNFRRWTSFTLEDVGELVTFASVVALAGGVPQIKVNEETGESEVVDTDFHEQYVLDSKTGRFIHRVHLTEYCRAAFDNEHIGETPLNSKGNPTAPTAYVQGKMEAVADTMYAPSLERVFISAHDGRKYLNTYQEPQYLNTECHERVGVLDRVRKHIAHLLEDEREQEIVLYYLAHNVQKVGVKLPWGIILQGTPGDGKSFFAEMMLHLMGMNNVRVMNADTLQASFTGWAAGQCMVFIEELKLDNYKKYEIVNRIKPYISNPTVEWNRKGKDPITVPNTSNYFCLTNHKDAIPLDDEDRRYAVMFSRWQDGSIAEFVEDNPNYYPELYDYMRNNLNSLWCELKELEIPKWFLALNRAPQTAAKREMIELTRGESYKDMVAAIDEYRDIVLLDDGDTLNVTALYKQIGAERMLEGDEALYANVPDPVREGTKLNRLLAELGWAKVVKRKRINGMLSSLYIKKKPKS